MPIAERHEHHFRDVVRLRGQKVRYGCTGCSKIGPWITFVNAKDVPPLVFEHMTLPQLRRRARLMAGADGNVSIMTKAQLIELLSTPTPAERMDDAS